jgi:hypothetical protein
MIRNLSGESVYVQPRNPRVFTTATAGPARPGAPGYSSESPCVTRSTSSIVVTP